MTINPVTAARAIVAIVKAIRARRAKRRITHRDDIEAVPGGARTVEPMDLPEKPTENE